MQTTLCVPLEVKPDSCARLVALIEALKQKLDDRSDTIRPNFSRLMEQVPVLHFMSMSVFLESDYDPIFIIEANFDGPTGPFWAMLDALIGDDLRHMLRCCKRPRDSTRSLYDSVTAQDATRFVAPYLEARTQRPSVFHHGNRGLTCARIQAERKLFLAIAKEIDPEAGPSPYRGIAPEEVHRKLRTALLADPEKQHAWLGEKALPRISALEYMSDWAKLLGFAFLLLLVLAAPGLLLVALHPGGGLKWAVLTVGVVLLLILAWRAAGDTSVARYGALAGAAALAAGAFAFHGIGGNQCWLFAVIGTPVGLAFLTLTLIAVANAPVGKSWAIGGAFVGAASLVVAGSAYAGLGWACWYMVAVGTASVVLCLAILVLWLRGLELRDSPQDRPELNERIRRKMLRREDWVTQNHMGSIVLIKPGALRSILIHTGHFALNLTLRAFKSSRAGYLGSLRTVHFAHWAFLDNHSRLLFLSNFDHSWDSYLDDFIEKAHGGLTLAWSCGVGFPTTRLLFGEGATQGRKFKAWALASRTVSRFWFSAYPDLTVDQIERHNRIADGLRQPRLSPTQAMKWMRDL